ncbi:MAG TPA: helix-turn-helix domain-containing protein [Dehalococcoidia bacterium]|nr:helix-turn-helix domain-containing protein [Dehalococcoidia bacterium]
MHSLEGMITVTEAAQRLGRSLEQVRRYLREGKLKGQRIGGQWFVDEASLPMRYEIGERPSRSVREPGVTMEAARLTREEIEALIRRVDENREAIRRRLGRDIDVVEMLRRSREGH